MRGQPIGAFVLECFALVDPKTVLFVHNGQPQIGKSHIGLDEGVRADGHLCLAAGQRFISGAFVACALASRQENGRNPQRLQQLAQATVMLFGQNFGGSHEGALCASGHGRHQCRRRHHRLARAHIPLQHSAHRLFMG